MRLRILMAIIAALALVLALGTALHRRSSRFSAVSLDYSRAAGRLEVRLPELEPDEVQPLLDRVHWNDAVAEAYREAASRPWLPGEPDLGKITCHCSYHAKLATTRPGP